MPKSFLIYAEEVDAGELPEASPQEQIPSPPPNREPLKILIIGSRWGVLSTIRTLHRLRFAEVHEWSPLLPAPTPGEVMSILSRYIRRNDAS